MSSRRQKKILSLYKTFKGVCVFCGRKVREPIPGGKLSKLSATRDHVIPESIYPSISKELKAVLSRKDRIILACAKCNNTRNSKSFIYWLRCKQTEFLFNIQQ